MMTKTGRPSESDEPSTVSIFDLPSAIFPTFLHSPRLSSRVAMIQRSPWRGSSRPDLSCQPTDGWVITGDVALELLAPSQRLLIQLRETREGLNELSRLGPRLTETGN